MLILPSIGFIPILLLGCDWNLAILQIVRWQMMKSNILHNYSRDWVRLAYKTPWDINPEFEKCSLDNPLNEHLCRNALKSSEIMPQSARRLFCYLLLLCHTIMAISAICNELTVADRFCSSPVLLLIVVESRRSNSAMDIMFLFSVKLGCLKDDSEEIQYSRVDYSLGVRIATKTYYSTRYSARTPQVLLRTTQEAKANKMAIRAWDHTVQSRRTRPRR